ncbi:MAG: isopeptide-forming domain-containing fimbrial protein [Halofilum sp. (in: g-proteobacteria)]|nr:isopeptide-forming domain-containing fimbrial protein [Halofilum sp. (in: g-proteobacteria)]
MQADGTDTGSDFSLDRARALAVGFQLEKSLADSSEIHTVDPEIAVGEDADFELRARWFGLDTGAGEAVRDITVRDRLDPAAGRLGYVTRTDSTADGASIASVNGTPAGLLSPPPVVSGSVDWQLDDITANGGGTLTSDLTARLLNIDATVKGDTVSNALDATFSVDYGAGNPSFDFASGAFGGDDAELAATADITVAEPSVGFRKEVRNVTQTGGFQDANDDAGAVDAEGGDIVEYRVTIDNAATGADAPVFGLIVDDQLVTDDIVLDETTAGIDTDDDGTVDISCGDYTAGPPDRIVFDSDVCNFGSPGSNLEQLDPGSTITILYRGEVQVTVNPEEVADNGAELTDAWSLADPDGDRSHVGDQNAPTGTKGDEDGARNHPASDIARVIIENDTQITKTVTDTTSPFGDGGDGEPDLRVGDGLTYEVVVDLAPESTIENFTITDTLPPGFEFTGDVSSFSFDDFSPSNPNPPPPSAGDTTHTWDFGTVTISDTDGDGTTTPELRFSYDVVTVDADPDGNGNEVEIPPPADISLDEENAATLEFDTGGGGTFTATGTAPVDVLQPLLSAAKTSSPSPPDRVGENDTVTYTITIDNPSQGTAYDPVIEDVIPEGMRGGGVAGITTTSISVGGTGLATCAPIDPDGDFAGSGDVRWVLDGNTGGCTDDYTLGPGEQLVLVYEVAVDDDIGADLPLPNAARALEWFSFDDDDVPGLPGATHRSRAPRVRPHEHGDRRAAHERAGQPRQGQPRPRRGHHRRGVHVHAAGAERSLDARRLDLRCRDHRRAAGGGYVRLRELHAQRRRHRQPDLRLRQRHEHADDRGYGGRHRHPAAGVHRPHDHRPRRQHDRRQDAGDTFVNTARYAFSSIDDDGTQENSGGPDVTTAPMTILEPLITPTKQARNLTAGDGFGGLTPPDAGDLVEYCLTFDETRGAAASTAFDLAFSDTLPPEAELAASEPDAFRLADGSCDPAGADPSNTLVAPAVTGTTPQTLTWDRASNDVDVPAGGAVSVLYKVRMRDALAPATVLTNAATVDWTSLDGADTNERTDATAPAEPDDYRASTDTSFTSADTTQVAKTEVSTPPLGDGGDGDGDYRLGERVTYRVEITDLTEGTLEDFSVTDTLPAGLEYEAGSATITQGGAISPDPAATPEPDGVTGSGAPGDAQTLTWDFGDVVNEGESPKHVHRGHAHDRVQRAGARRRAGHRGRRQRRDRELPRRGRCGGRAPGFDDDRHRRPGVR